MYVKYGTYSHEIGQDSITYTVEPQYSQWRGFQYASKVTMTAQGVLQPTATKTLSARIDDFLAAYNTNGKTFGLYHDSGAATQHVIDSTHLLLKDGPKVIVRKWPKGDRGEYACHREYFVEVSAVFSYNDTNDPWPGIVKYQEKMRYVGQGAIYRKFLYDQDAKEWEQTIYGGFPIKLIQSGSSIGWAGYALPLDAVEPSRLLEHLTIHEPGPIYLGTEFKGTEYHYRWSYTMELPAYTTHIHFPKSR